VSYLPDGVGLAQGADDLPELRLLPGLLWRLGYMVMDLSMTLGEYVRHLRRRKAWGLQELADTTGLSVSHLSRIENDAAIPNPETVVKLSKALEGRLESMLEMAKCLPEEILDRLLDRATGNPVARATGGVRGDGAVTCLRCGEELVEAQRAKNRRELVTWLRELDRRHSGRQGAIWAEIVAVLGLFADDGGHNE